jgi:hypothetical protein
MVIFNLNSLFISLSQTRIRRRGGNIFAEVCIKDGQIRIGDKQSAGKRAAVIGNWREKCENVRL